MALSTPVPSPSPSVMVATPKPLSVETANSNPLWFYLKSDPLLTTQTQHVYAGVSKQSQRNSFSSYPTDFFQAVILSGILETAIGIYIFFLSAPVRTWSQESPAALQPESDDDRVQSTTQTACPTSYSFLLKYCPLTYTNFGLFHFILCNRSFDEPCPHRFGKRTSKCSLRGCPLSWFATGVHMSLEFFSCQTPSSRGSTGICSGGFLGVTTLL